MTSTTPAMIDRTPTTATDRAPAPRSSGAHYMAAKSENTQTAYRQALRDFADAFGLDDAETTPDKITDASLCRYVEIRAETHKPATIAARASILRTLASDAGSPIIGNQHRDALKAITRSKGLRPEQAKGFSLSDYHRALAQCPDDMRGIRDAALIALAYCTASRASELVAYRFEDIDTEARTILLRRSKTDQTGMGKEKHLTPDALATIAAWSNATGITTGPIVRSVNKGGKAGEGMTTRALAKIIKRLLGADYSPHSVRVGFVQSAVEKGLTAPEISLTTGQSPQTIQRYYEKADQSRSAAAKMLG